MISEGLAVVGQDKEEGEIQVARPEEATEVGLAVKVCV